MLLLLPYQKNFSVNLGNRSSGRHINQESNQTNFKIYVWPKTKHTNSRRFWHSCDNNENLTEQTSKMCSTENRTANSHREVVVQLDSWRKHEILISDRYRPSCRLSSLIIISQEQLSVDGNKTAFIYYDLIWIFLKLRWNDKSCHFLFT